MTFKDAWLTQYAFKEFVPATNNPELGWPKLPLAEALTKRFIYTNPAKLTSMLCVDVDKEDAERFILSKVWDDGEAPEPNWITINPGSSHAHAGYWLKSPVSTSDASSHAARVYLYDTQRKLTSALSGDVSYSHLSTRSPFMLNHYLRSVREEPYELGELAETLKHIKLLKTYKLGTPQGRNVAMFETIRLRAYETRRKIDTYTQFHAFILSLTRETNIRMNAHLPLADSELQSIANSIAKWTWRNITPEKLTATQSFRASKRWEKVKQGDISKEKRLLRLADTRDEVLFLRSRNLTHNEIARATGLTKDQVKNKLRYARTLNYN